MAIARCEQHTPDGTKHSYKVYALPIGYPQTAAICGRPGCEEPARIWLTEEEKASFGRGVRIFEIPTQAAKLRVAEELNSK